MLAGVPTPLLWDDGEVKWHLVQRLDLYRPRRKAALVDMQEPLFSGEMLARLGCLDHQSLVTNGRTRSAWLIARSIFHASLRPDVLPEADVEASVLLVEKLQRHRPLSPTQLCLDQRASL